LHIGLVSWFLSILSLRGRLNLGNKILSHIYLNLFIAEPSTLPIPDGARAGLYPEAYMAAGGKPTPYALIGHCQRKMA
jgi:hypothetical protein